MKHGGLKFLSLLLTLALLVGLLSGMSAYAALSITIEPAGSGTVSQNETVVPGNVFCTAIPNDDYAFQKWTFVAYGTSRTNSSANTVFPASGATDIVAHFVKTVSSVSINPTSATLTEGSKQMLTATISPDDAGNKKVHWFIDGSSVKLYSDAACTSEIGTDATETLTVYAKGISAGSATITLQSNESAQKNATCTVTVNAANYTMTFKHGAGSGTEQQLTATAGADYQLPRNMFGAPEGKVFAGWKDDATGTVYNELATIQNVSKNYTFTAQWGESRGKLRTNGSGFGADIVFNIPGADNSWEYVGGGYVPQRAYRVSLAPMQGGSAAFGLTTGESGAAMNVYPTSAVYVFPNAEPGYVLDKIVWSLIDGSASYDITEAKNFVMPAMDVVVYVTFRPVG